MIWELKGAYRFIHHSTTWFVVQIMGGVTVLHVRFTTPDAAHAWLDAHGIDARPDFTTLSPHDMFTYIPVGGAV